MRFKSAAIAALGKVMASGVLCVLMSAPAQATDAGLTTLTARQQHHHEADGAWRDVFGTMTVRTNRIAGYERWEAMLARASRGCGANCPSRWQEWVRTIQPLATVSPYAQLKVVNWLANEALPYRSDTAAFGMTDYWASPPEALRAGGDCEDYVALKYLALRSAGFPVEHLRIVILQDLQRKQPHAVLVGQIDGRRLVLDNQLDDLASDIELAHYKPLFSFNEHGKWVHLELREHRKLALSD